MAAVVTFDTSGPLRIIEISAGGDNELDWLEIYSEWKEWAALSDNLKYPPAFRVVGGDPISDVQDLGSTFFLLAPWKFRPSEEDHRLVVNGNLFTDPAGESPFVETIGSFTVLAESKVSNLVDASVARLDLTQLQPAVFVDSTYGIPGTEVGVGTPTNPVDNLPDAFTIAARDGLREFCIRGTFTLDRDATEWKFVGLGPESSAVLNIAGFDVDGSSFVRCSFLGDMVGTVQADSCTIQAVTGLDGLFRDCGFQSTASFLDSGSSVLQRCFSEVPGTQSPVLTFGATSVVNIRGWAGGLSMEGVETGTQIAVDMDPARVSIEASCSGGAIVLRGVGTVANNGTGTLFVGVEGLVDGAQVRDMHALWVPTTDIGNVTISETNQSAGSRWSMSVLEAGGTVTLSRL